MNLLQRFKNNIKQLNLFSTKDKLLLAVSGGVDSVVLCELCKQAGYDFVIAHCNFQLRGEESDRDEKFVVLLEKKYGVEVLVKKFDTKKYARENKTSIQEAARELRYDWFKELINLRLNPARMTWSDGDSVGQELTNKPINFLLTAHHADDNTETISMNFFRGTGLHGMTGIPASAGYVRRPLLSFSKDELLEFAKENNLDFVEDSSNLSSGYTRNFFRNEIIPYISKVYPQVKENLQDNINRFKEIENLYNLTVGELKKKLCRQKGTEIHIPVKQLMGFHNKALIYEIISDYGFTEKQVDEVLKLAESESGHYIENARYRFIKHRHWFIIAPKEAKQADHIIIEEGIGNWELGIGNLVIELLPDSGSQTLPAGWKVPNSPNIAYLDSKNIQFPLLLRKWKTGDYFYPLGMKKKKKLARFFIDQKLSKTDKEKVWVLEMNEKIIWVVGYRIDERFKVTDQTKKILKVTLHPQIAFYF